jgi:hypothetical protein
MTPFHHTSSRLVHATNRTIFYPWARHLLPPPAWAQLVVRQRRARACHKLMAHRAQVIGLVSHPLLVLHRPWVVRAWFSASSYPPPPPHAIDSSSTWGQGRHHLRARARLSGLGCRQIIHHPGLLHHPRNWMRMKKAYPIFKWGTWKYI